MNKKMAALAVPAAAMLGIDSSTPALLAFTAPQRPQQ